MAAADGVGGNIPAGAAAPAPAAAPVTQLAPGFHTLHAFRAHTNRVREVIHASTSSAGHCFVSIDESSLKVWRLGGSAVAASSSSNSSTNSSSSTCGGSSDPSSSCTGGSTGHRTESSSSCNVRASVWSDTSFPGKAFVSTVCYIAASELLLAACMDGCLRVYNSQMQLR